ncbi:uncharacterized protein LODBEIA_P12670 [Lodderomyces beijingensis]|uniref:BSD domain-containing protein n=1 Tax=Lodderomyces beijingensis TaxID=1775926 RepID=A0ABP0ZFV1_9ASCO
MADPIISEVDVPVTTGKPDSTEQNDINIKTEQTMEALEDRIDKAYGLVEHRFQELWKETSDNVHLLNDKYHLDEYKDNLRNQLSTMKESLRDSKNVKSVTDSLKSFEKQVENLKLEDRLRIKDFSKTASNALDVIDSKLELVENEASKYISSFTSFFSNIISISDPDVGKEASQSTETLFNSNLNQHVNYGTSRYDTDLLKLHTQHSFYTSDACDVAEDLKNFNADSKTGKIESLLKQYPDTLTSTMNELVPVKVSYNTFWYRYFANDDKLKSMEKQRRELLSREKQESEISGSTGKGGGDDDEDFKWDDEEEEEELEEDGEDETHTTPTQEEEEVSKSKEHTQSAETEDDDGEDEDDDWE